MLSLIVEETEEQIYKDMANFERAKQNFETFFEKAQMSERFFIICAWLGLLDLIILLILFFYAKSIVIKIISGLKIIQNYDRVKGVDSYSTE